MGILECVAKNCQRPSLSQFTSPASHCYLAAAVCSNPQGVAQGEKGGTADLLSHLMSALQLPVLCVHSAKPWGGADQNNGSSTSSLKCPCVLPVAVTAARCIFMSRLTRN